MMSIFYGEKRTMELFKSSTLKLILLAVHDFRTQYRMRPNFIGLNVKLRDKLLRELLELEVQPDAIMNVPIVFFSPILPEMLTLKNTTYDKEYTI